MAWLIYIVVAIGGGLNAVQAGANAQLTKTLGPGPAAIAVYLAGIVVMGSWVVVTGHLWPGLNKIAAAPWWAWVGGFLGAFYVITMLLFAEKLGSAVFTGLTVTAAIVTSLILDHFGWAGFHRHPAGRGRIVGAGLMIGGLGLIAYL